MPGQRTAFKQADLTRACKGMIAAGLPVARAEIDPRTGKIVVHTVGTPTDDETNDWD